MESIGAILPAGNEDVLVHFGARRRHQRYSLNAEVRLHEPVSSRGFVLNVSAGGMRVAVEDEVAVDALCAVEVLLTERRRPVEHCRVVWARREPDGWILGLEFVPVH